MVSPLMAMHRKCWIGSGPPCDARYRPCSLAGGDFTSRVSILTCSQSDFGAVIRSMKTISQAAYTRISVMLLAVCLGSLAWETSLNSDLVSITGEIVRSEYIYGKKVYTVRYSMDGNLQSTTSRIGILDLLRGMGRLRVGDRLPMAVSREPGGRSVPDTLTGRYGITLSFFVLAALFFLATGWAIFRGRLKVSRPR